MTVKFLNVRAPAAPRWLTRGFGALSLVSGALLGGTPGCTGSVDPDGAKPPPDDIDVIDAPLCEGPRGVGAGRWRRLTASQYANAVQDLIGERPDTTVLLGDFRTGAFKANALQPVDERDVGAYDTLAKTLSEKAVSNLLGLLSCDTKAMGEDTCAAQFIKSFGARAYRRPLLADEEAAFESVYKTGKEENFSAGIRLVVQAMLSSPNFLYLVEAGGEEQDGMRKLTGYEIASRLAFVLTGTMPDSSLFAAAEAGELDTAEGVQEYAKKLISSDRFLGVAKEFHVELLGFDDVTSEEVSKSGKFADFTSEMRKAMAEEPRKFVDYVMTKGSGSIEEMFSAPYVFPEGPLSRVYGGVVADEDGRAEITDGSRHGLLTLAGVQASHPKQLSPRGAVNRGHLVRREVLCEPVPPVTGPVDFTLPPGAENMTAQELLRVHQENPTCKGCHELMDSIGFGFESYDAMGAFRTKDDGGNVIETSGEVVNIEGDGKFRNTEELASLLSKSPAVRKCMSQQWLRFSLGRDPEDQDSCSLAGVSNAFLKGKGDIKSAVLSLVVSDSFRFYRGQ